MTRENSDLLHNFAERMREVGSDYTSELLAENKQLVDLAAALYTSNEQLHAKQDQAAHARQLASASQKSRELNARFAEAEHASERLAKWFVALGRLHEASTPEQVAKQIGEVLSNLVGSKRFAVFVASRSRESVRLAASLGVDKSVIERLPAMNGHIAGACRGIAYVRIPGEEPAIDLEAELNTCIPLRAHDLTLGAVALFDSTSAPPTMRGAELEALTLIVKHGGSALLGCRLLHLLNARQTVAA